MLPHKQPPVRGVVIVAALSGRDGTTAAGEWLLAARLNTIQARVALRLLGSVPVSPTPYLQRARAEGVALARLAAVEAALEPARALRGAAVCERFRAHHTGRLLLQRVVADHVGRLERFFQIAGFEDVAALRAMAPHTGVAVRLQLEPHQQPALAGLL